MKLVLRDVLHDSQLNVKKEEENRDPEGPPPAKQDVPTARLSGRPQMRAVEKSRLSQRARSALSFRTPFQGTSQIWNLSDKS